MNEDSIVIYGKHVVHEALMHRPDVVVCVYISSDTPHGGIVALVNKHKIVRHDFDSKKLPKGVPTDAVHQDVVALISLKKFMSHYEEYMRTCVVTPHTAFVLLGEVQDPQNVGGVIRSAAAFGVSGILIPEHRQAPVNGTVLKVSAGAAFSIPLIRIGNVNATISDLKARGFWIYGLDGNASQSVHDEKFEKPTVLVLGNEATGIREKTLEHCDIPLRIPIKKGIESLNAATAASVVLYAWSVEHGRAL